MSMEDKLKAMGEKAKAAFHDLKGEVHEIKDEAAEALERAKLKAAEESGRMKEKVDETKRDVP